ncbi:ATP-binding protein [Shewanella sedimentimangrovi]|uniref:histidine kinase n=1 Tax=Shewanella sedimentimangrovi TaxID=2814293 RepID=A0ABX7R1M5_9GAMM|nr:ATP-binding protein [Shewanella sedimentimangrovi]QSX37090.1 HAMP domain-containing protein [Shewanella sedimentimangrovi]
MKSLSSLLGALSPNRLFIKLLLGFWLGSSVIIVAIGSLPLLQQRLDTEPLPPHLQQLLERAARPLIERPGLMTTERIRHWDRMNRRDDKPVRLILVDDEGKVLNDRPSRQLLNFMLLAEDAGHPISHQYRDDLLFGPFRFQAGTDSYALYGRLPGKHPRPWFMFFNENKMLTLGLAVLLSGLLCGLLAWHLGKPLRQLKHSADTLAAGQLDSRVDSQTARRRDELGQVARAFNGMADAVETMVRNQQRLMGDISHELRTPLTRLQLALALARKRGEETPEINRIAYEASQLEQLIAELLTLSRLQLNAQEPKRLLSLGDSLDQVLDDADFEASEQNKQLHISLDEEFQFQHYPKILARAVENLLRNAIRYANGAIWLSSELQENNLILRICDDGPGVAEAELGAIFQPFYRPDTSRERESGGWGLGLAITAAAVQAHGGEIRAENRPEGGLCVSLSLPLTSSEQR